MGHTEPTGGAAACTRSTGLPAALWPLEAAR